MAVSNPYEAILDKLIEGEAKDWLRRYAKKVEEVGRPLARVWWDDTISDIEKKRGTKNANMLRVAMNKEVEKRKVKK
jgi:hypothetical protein